MSLGSISSLQVSRGPFPAGSPAPPCARASTDSCAAGYSALTKSSFAFALAESIVLGVPAAAAAVSASGTRPGTRDRSWQMSFAPRYWPSSGMAALCPSPP